MNFINEIDEIDKMCEDNDFIPLETLMMELNCLSTDNHQIWYLYKQFNIKHFNEKEIKYIDDIIDKLINQHRKLNKITCNKLKPREECLKPYPTQVENPTI